MKRLTSHRYIIPSDSILETHTHTQKHTNTIPERIFCMIVPIIIVVIHRQAIYARIYAFQM